MRQTFSFETRPRIAAHAAAVGPKEAEGPLAEEFDILLEDDLLGLPSWELAEAEMARRACMRCLEKGNFPLEDVEALLGGDLLNQLMATGINARALGAPFLGLYGACSTMAEGIALAAALVDGGYRESALVCASSHFCTAERQFRFPLELGTQRPPSAQWTATAAGAALIRPGRGEKGGVRVTHATIGRVVDYEISDASHMGAAMTPAVADTIQAHLRDTGRAPGDYDCVVTGDLGAIGRELLLALLRERGVVLEDGLVFDCGANLYAPEQDCHAGGSGCGCIASVLAGRILRRMESREMRRVLAIGSGAMTSVTSAQQGLSIPSIAHAVALEVDA